MLFRTLFSPLLSKSDYFEILGGVWTPSALVLDVTLLLVLFFADWKLFAVAGLLGEDSFEIFVLRDLFVVLVSDFLNDS